jgi:hypothetical protein
MRFFVALLVGTCTSSRNLKPIMDPLLKRLRPHAARGGPWPKWPPLKTPLYIGYTNEKFDLLHYSCRQLLYIKTPPNATGTAAERHFYIEPPPHGSHFLGKHIIAIRAQIFQSWSRNILQTWLSIQACTV